MDAELQIQKILHKDCTRSEKQQNLVLCKNNFELGFGCTTYNNKYFPPDLQIIL